MLGSACDRLAAAAAALIAGTAQAETPPVAQAAAERSPIALRVVVKADALRELYTHSPVYSSGPPIVGCDVPVGAQARHAWEQAAHRWFDAGADAAHTLAAEVSVGGAEVESSGGSFAAAVEHRVVLHDSEGREVDRLILRGRERIVGLSQDALMDAFSRAAERATEAFDAELDTSAGVSAWLWERGISRRTSAAARPPSPGQADVPLRTWRVHVDVGIGVVKGSYGTNIGPAASVGVSASWLFVNANALRWRYVYGRQQFDPQESVGDGIEIAEMGLEVGAARRLGLLEVHAAMGRELYRGTITDWPMREHVSSSATSLSAGLTVASGVERLRMRWRAGLEGRMRFGANFTTALHDYTGASGRSTSLALAGPSLVVFLGAELGTGAASDR